MFNKCLVKHIFFFPGNALESTLTETALLIRGCFEYQVHINVVKRWFLYVLVINKHSRTVHHFGWYERNKWECFIAVYQNVCFGGCSLSISFLSLARLRWTGGFCINLKMYKHDIQILHASQIMNYLVFSTQWRKKHMTTIEFLVVRVLALCECLATKTTSSTNTLSEGLPGIIHRYFKGFWEYLGELVRMMQGAYTGTTYNRSYSACKVQSYGP